MEHVKAHNQLENSVTQAVSGETVQILTNRHDDYQNSLGLEFNQEKVW